MKKILIFSTAYLPLVGGAEVAVKEITDRLPDYQFHLITAKIKPGLSSQERIGNVNVYRIGWGNWFDKIYLATLGAQRLNRWEADVVWSIMASWGSIAAVIYKFFHPKVKLVINLQEGDPIEGRRFGLVGLVWRLVLRKADLVTVISNYLGDLARKYGYKGPIELVPNAVDTGRFSPSNFQGSTLEGRRELGIKEEDVVLITTSRLVKKNAVGDIIEALKFLPNEVKLLIAGTGPLESKLKLVTSRQSLDARVRFLGQIDHSDLPKYLHVSDIFVRPSLSEGLGNSFLEAMAAGLPIIGTPVGGIPDFLRDGETGLFCQVANPKSIAGKVKLLISDLSLRSKLIENSRRLVFEKYNWDRIAAQTRTIFRKLG